MADDSERDVPLTLAWRMGNPDAYEGLGLPPLRSRARTVARHQLITEAAVVGRAEPDAWVSYSRRKAWWAAHNGRYYPSTFSYANVVPTVDELAAMGLLEHEKQTPGTLKHPDEPHRLQSRFRATPTLLRLFDEQPQLVICDPRERIVLRDSDGHLVEYDDSARTRKQRRNLEQINEALRSATLSVAGQRVREGDAIKLDNVEHHAAKVTLNRIFNRSSFNLGGRFYGGFWQNIPKAYRSQIEIDGIGTQESDYSQLHPTMLYAEAGQRLEGDAYELADWPRELCKVAFNVLINADTLESAIRAIAKEIGGQGARKKAEQLVAEIKAKHLAIADMFGTGAGLRLQRTDGHLAEMVLLKLLQQGFVALPIHDSFIVPNTGNNVAMLDDIMDETLSRFLQQNPAFCRATAEKVPQYGRDGVGAGDTGWLGGGTGQVIGAVLYLLPPQEQRDMFGHDTMSIPVGDMSSFKNGVAPETLRKALRHEMKRRKLTHGEAARRIGISRPQFENILQGRFGGSDRVAANIKRFLGGKI